MFRIATERGRQVELSATARRQGIAAAEAYGLLGKLFVNTHPDELIDAPSLLSCMEALQAKYPRAEIVVEVHETSIASFSGLSDLRRRLTDVGIGLAFDDFGAGQSRLLELTSVKPDFIKFDRSLVSQIDQAQSDRIGVLRSLVNIVLDLGITPLAEGIETQGEADICRQLGFELAQGYLYGRPLAARDWANQS
jgi:EAL domain-containing protein (putative c-di-GMP-specific phosphodiesterase class I)